jgi:hypothetical protein
MVRLEELVHDGPRIHLTTALVKRLLQVHFFFLGGGDILFLKVIRVCFIRYTPDDNEPT